MPGDGVGHLLLEGSEGQTDDLRATLFPRTHFVCFSRGRLYYAMAVINARDETAQSKMHTCLQRAAG